MSIHQIAKFERLNDISVNVYTIEVKKKGEANESIVLPIRLTEQSRQKHVNLLHIIDPRDMNRTFCMHKESVSTRLRTVMQIQEKDTYMRQVCRENSIICKMTFTINMTNAF